MATSKIQPSTFGTTVSKVVVSSKKEIHIKVGAQNGKSVNVAKYVNTRNYKGFAKGGLMIPLENWKDFVAAVTSKEVEKAIALMRKVSN